MSNKLEIKNLTISRGDKIILSDFNLGLKASEIHVLMGPNGSGKSSLANALMGHPEYELTTGKIIVNGEDVTNLKVNERAKRGLFLSMQNPPEISGVPLEEFLRNAYNAIKDQDISPADFHIFLKEKMKKLKMDYSFLVRGVNEGLSGGERKKSEALQLAVLNPEYAILDETDSGLDVDALKVVAESINESRADKMGVLLITHHTRILSYLRPDRVSVIKNGKLVAEGGAELASQIEQTGYDSI